MELLLIRGQLNALQFEQIRLYMQKRSCYELNI